MPSNTIQQQRIEIKTVQNPTNKDNTENIPSPTIEIQDTPQEPIVTCSSRHVSFRRHNEHFYYT